MIRATSHSASRAAQRLISDERECNCSQAERLTARVAALHALADKLEAENARLRAELEGK